MNENKESRKSLAFAMSFAGLGFSLGFGALAALWVGNWVDEKLGTSPLFLLLLLAGLLVGSMRRLIWMLKQNSRPS